MVRVVGYIRVSSEEQGERGVSMDAQRDRLEAYCTAHGFELVEMEGDNGVSGKVTPAKREGFADALQLIRDG